MRDAAFALVWAVMFPITFWSPHVGVLLWVWVALIAPNEQLYGIMSSVPYNKVVALVTIVMLVVSRERKQFYLDAMVVLLIVFTLVATGSAYGSIADDAGNWDIYGKLIKEVALALVICGVMWSRHRIHMLLIAICLGYGFAAMSEGGQFLITAGGHKVLGASSVGDNNSLATAVLMIIPLLLYLIQYSAWRPAKLAFIGLLAFSVLCVIGTYSRGGFIGMVILAGMFVRNSRRKLRSIVVVVLAGALVVTLAPESWYARLNTLNHGADDSFMQRVTVWKVSTLIALDHPIFGGGLHAVQTWPVWTAYAARLPSLAWIDTPPPDPFPRAAHSSYFEVLGDLGFTGLAVFLLLLVVAVLDCSRILRLCRRRPDLVWAADLARMLQVTVVIYAVTTISLSMAYFEGLFIMLALSSRLLRTVRQTIAGTLPTRTVALPASRAGAGLPGLPAPAFRRPAA